MTASAPPRKGGFLRLETYLDHVQEAARDAIGFLRDHARQDLDGNRLLRRGVVNALGDVGEAMGRITEGYPEFAAAHPEMPWRVAKNMRNAVLHGYFIDLEVIWNTVKDDLPALLAMLPAVQASAREALVRARGTTVDGADEPPPLDR